MRYNLKVEYERGLLVILCLRREWRAYTWVTHVAHNMDQHVCFPVPFFEPKGQNSSTGSHVMLDGLRFLVPTGREQAVPKQNEN